MQALTRMIQTIGRQFRDFSITARLLMASLMVILAMGLIFVALYAGRPDLLPLGLGANLSGDGRDRAIAWLDARGIAWQESAAGGDILVASDRVYEVRAALVETQLVSPDELDFSSLVAQDSPFLSRDARRNREILARQNEVARTIKAMAGVKNATVFYAQTDVGRGLGAARIEPRASVMVWAAQGDLASGQADAIARFVSGTLPGLKISAVEIVDGLTGRSVPVRTNEDLAPTRHLELKQTAERLVGAKLESHFSYIPGVRVAVNAQVDSDEVQMHETRYEDPKVGPTRERSSEMASSGESGGGSPGIRANTGESLATGRATSTTRTESDTSSQTVFPQSQSVTKRAGGQMVKIGASILVPRSYLVGIHRERSGDAEATPDEAAVQTLFDAEKAAILAAVAPLIDTSGVQGAVAGQVVVNMYSDTVAAAVGTIGSSSVALAGGVGGGMVSSLVDSGLVRGIGLSLLALVSLTLMFMLVRKSSRQDELPSAEELVGIPPALAEAPSDLVGEADEGIAPMEGLEIDEAQLKRQQMLDQINGLAVSEPSEAAGLLRKWVQSDEAA